MRQVIGEIGGSSSRWATIAEDGTVSTWPLKGERLLGFNPVSGEGGEYAGSISSYFHGHQPGALAAERIAIYGAGCGTDARRSRMRDAITAIWPVAQVTVDTDLMGAALGLAGSTPSMVLILGTGMNAGYFDGRQLITPMPSLGYILGDEGSGADIGRNLLQDAFYDRIPAHVKEMIFGAQGPVLADVLEQVHRALHPGKELASYTALLAPHSEEPYVRELLQGRFHTLAELLTQFFLPDQLRNMVATGSVAYFFREVLAECLLDRGMTLNCVEPDPLPGLVRYHLQPAP